MPKITALIHTHNDAQRLGRALESLRPCDEVLVIDHDSQDETEKVARAHGANVKRAVSGVSPGAYLVDASNDWLLVLLPSEALSETLEATLFEWKERDHEATAVFALSLREENETGGWNSLGAHTRLVNRNTVNWTADLPADMPGAEVEVLEGDLLRFRNP
jgi:glycosyltransferase involved in cell wall biosynthesis